MHRHSGCDKKWKISWAQSTRNSWNLLAHIIRQGTRCSVVVMVACSVYTFRWRHTATDVEAWREPSSSACCEIPRRHTEPGLTRFVTSTEHCNCRGLTVLSFESLEKSSSREGPCGFGSLLLERQDVPGAKDSNENTRRLIFMTFSGMIGTCEWRPHHLLLHVHPLHRRHPSDRRTCDLVWGWCEWSRCKSRWLREWRTVPSIRSGLLLQWT